MRTSRLILAVVAGTLLVGLLGFAGGYRVGAQGQGKISDTLAAAIGRQLGQQLTNASPFNPDPPDHLWIAADDKTGVFLHFDKPLADASRLIYVGYAVKGRWCSEDQQRIEALAGKGFTHFHREAQVAAWDAGHGGARAGEAGWWFKHVAVGPGFKMPWGDVKANATDMAFMPTTAPRCGS